MNPVNLALERALETATDRVSLAAAFERELTALQFAPDAEATVYAVPFRHAQLWSKGKLSDVDLLLSVNGEPGAIFFLTLPNIRSFFVALEKCREIYDQGAKAFITYTSNPVVQKHCESWGCKVTYKNEGVRLYADANTMKAWTFFRRKITADSETLCKR